MKTLLMAAAAVSLVLPVHAVEPTPVPSPGEIAAAAPAGDWIAIPASDLLVMDLTPDSNGKARRVVIQLMPAPFSQGWIGNIRKLAAAHWWDGTSVNRVQDNYVAQWGDATEKKALPEGLVAVPESEYVQPVGKPKMCASGSLAVCQPAGTGLKSGDISLLRTAPRDAYAGTVGFYQGWPIAADMRIQSIRPDAEADGSTAWPVHCYGAVGVGRNMSPDTGSGAELYAVIGHAPRHLDRNIAVVGRVISGIEHLSSLPRGTGALGFYEDEAQRVPIASVRLASELPVAAQPKFEYLSTTSGSFALYADARQNRRDPFFIMPAGGADICNIAVPVRSVFAK